MTEAPPRLFASEQDAAQDLALERHLRRQHQAQMQSRCEACGRFACYPRDFVYDVICIRCTQDRRPAIMAKVEQVKLWWRSRSGYVGQSSTAP